MPGAPKAPPSFIPHDAGEAIHPHRRGSSGLLELFTLIAVVLFVGSAALGAGVFLYDQFLRSSLTSKKAQLERASAAFEPELIHQLARLDDRMRVAGDVLGRHVAVSALFRMLEQTTVSAITFRSLGFEGVESDRMTLRMEGVAGSMNAIALQADLFTKVGMVTSPIFSNIDRKPDGVHFSFNALINPSAINYTNLIRGVSQALPEQIQTTPVPTEPVSPFDAPPAEEPALDE